MGSADIGADENSLGLIGSPTQVKNIFAPEIAKDRKMIRQILHQMSPQLQFFGVPEIVPRIKGLAYEYQTKPWEELEEMALSEDR